ncbi:MAG TPA: type VI secretion system membrane subunit TssM [Polyangiaceae bacterium]
MWIWLLAIVLVIGAWVGGFLLEWPLWLEILITVFAVLLVIGWAVAGRVRGMLKARALERDMLKQAEQQALNARPDRRAEIMELQAQMQRGLQALRASRVGNLYTLPWYMIIGPPGAGKTTALKQSGLAFPFLDPRSGGGVRGIGGTRNCDWWFTNEAILLDTAGRYATESDDHEEWTGFLDMLRRYRSRKPLNGMIVAISVTDLIEATEEQLDGFAKRLRGRIDEVTTRLQMMVPVYVMFTKVDLVAGFVEFWGDLRKSERGQIWGVTFPLAGSDRRDNAQAFAEEFDLLVDHVHARAVKRVGQERQPELKQRIYQFPLEFAGLKQNLQEFVGGLLQRNNFQETPILRGIYFSSGTQEGRPIDRVIGGMMRAFGLPAAGGPPQQPQAPQQGYGQTGYGQQPYGQQAYAQPPTQQGQTESKSYFVADLFRRVVFPDQHVAARTRSETRRQFVNRLVFALVALGLATLLAFPAVYTFARNTALVSDARDVAAEAQRINWSDGSPLAGKAHKLDDLRARLEQLEEWKKSGPPAGLRWGMYSGNDIYEPLRAVYTHTLQTGFVNPTKTQLERELGAVAGQSHLSVDQYGTFFARLKAYLEMSDPAHLEADGDWEAAALTDAWARAVGASSPADKAALRSHVVAYVGLLQRGEIPPWSTDAGLVTRVRAVLGQTSQTDRDYSALVRDANENVAPITKGTVFMGSNFATYVTSRSKPEVVVRGAFTRVGWDTYIRDRLDKDRAKDLAQDRWVLGQSEQRGIQLVEAELDQLSQRYFTEYRNAWADYLKDLEVRMPENNDVELKELGALSEAPWPYLKLLQTVAENTRLEPSPSSQLGGMATGALGAALGKSPGVAGALADAGVALPQKPKRWTSPVEDAFAPMVTFAVPGDGSPDAAQPTSLSHYLDQIVAKVVGVLTDLKDSKAPTDPRALSEAHKNAMRGTTELLVSQSTFTRPLLTPLLVAPLSPPGSPGRASVTGR